MLNPRFRAAVLLAASLATTACSTMQPVSDAQTALRKGDQIHVHTTGGQQYELEVVAVDTTSVTGITPEKTQIKLSFSELSRVDREEPDTAKTLGLTAVVIAVCFGIGAVLGKAAGRAITTQH